jgi:citrate synthase
MTKKTAGIDNQEKGYITAKEACAQLKVKPATLYSYVSRGLIHCIQVGGRAKLYSKEDTTRLRARSDANKGHTAVAAGALRWGEPVLDSKITRVEDGQLFYRGVNLLSLLAEKKTFEEVAQLLWETSSPLVWRPTAPLTAPLAQRPISRLLQVSSQRCLEDQQEPSHRITQYTTWVADFALTLGAALDAHSSLAEALCVGYQRPLSQAALFHVALIVCADHELNVSTFTARIAASAGSSLAACLSAALCTFTGKKHGGACEQLEETLQELAPLTNGERVSRVERWLAEKRVIPGFGHRLYQHQDPRTAPLLQAATEFHNQTPRYLSLQLLLTQMRQAGHVPTVDAAMVVVAEALSLPPGSATALFALGRTVGWLAHIEEQRQQEVMLRPRARYVGPR